VFHAESRGGGDISKIDMLEEARMIYVKLPL
jgi:hypothetical protein